MAEFAIVFPVQLFITLAVMQLSLLYVAHAVVSYAAFSAARAALVAEPGKAESQARRAAEVVCSAIAGPSGAGSTITVPGWGPLPRSGASTAKTKVEIRTDGEEVYATVDHNLELQIPVIGEVFAFPAKTFLGVGEGQAGDVGGNHVGGAPHLHIREGCVLVRPWKGEGEP